MMRGAPCLVTEGVFLQSLKRLESHEIEAGARLHRMVSLDR